MDILQSQTMYLYIYNIVICIVPPQKLKSFLFTFIFYDFNKVRFIIVI